MGHEVVAFVVSVYVNSICFVALNNSVWRESTCVKQAVVTLGDVFIVVA